MPFLVHQSVRKHHEIHHDGEAKTLIYVVSSIKPYRNRAVGHTARQVACHSLNNSRGKRSSITPHKTRSDSPVPTLQGPCYPSQKWRGTLTLLPQSEIRSSSIAPVPVMSREAPLNSTVSLTSQRNPAKLPEVMGTSRGNPGFPATPRERPREFFFEAS